MGMKAVMPTDDCCAPLAGRGEPDAGVPSRLIRPSSTQGTTRSLTVVPFSANPFIWT